MTTFLIRGHDNVDSPPKKNHLKTIRQEMDLRFNVFCRVYPTFPKPKLIMYIDRALSGGHRRDLGGGGRQGVCSPTLLMWNKL